MKENWIQSFIKSAGAILLAAALSRFLIATGNAPFLSLPDPALGIPLHYAVLMVGAVELLVAFICLFGRQIYIQTGWLAWLATNFVVFQAGLFWMHCHPQATCIGSLTDPLHLSRGASGFILDMLPVYLALGSYAALMQLWFANRGETERRVVKTVAGRPGTGGIGPAILVRFIKISCISCGGHIEFPTNLLGEKIPCPHCQATIILKRPETIKISCSVCDGHIEVPVHALGQKISCPHCSMEITLMEPA
jgi:DNA-directed RNA polymerase subunit RPC12/RpoP